MGGTSTGWRLAALLLAWLAGVALQLQQPALFAGGVYAALAAVGLICAALVPRRPRWFGLTAIGVAALAFGIAGGHASLRLGERLPAELEGRDLVLVGVVGSLPQSGSAGLRFLFTVEQATLQGTPVSVPPRISLGWYKGFHEDAVLSQPQSELRAGQRWRFAVRLRQPHGNLNPHGFDYELQLFERGVRATGYVRDAPAERLSEAAGHPVERWRQRVRDAIEAKVVEPRASGVLAALAVGDQAAIEREDWDLFRNTGVAHLMSISGLHVTMFAWLAGVAIGWLWRRNPRTTLWLPAPLAARWGGVAAALAYAVFCGWGVPAQRTVWMLALVTLLGTAGVHWPWALVLLAAAALVTALDPWALLQPGFWLSFAAVALLMASEPAQAPGPRVVAPTGWRAWPARFVGLMRGGLRTQVIATFGLAPLGLIFFQQLSLVGFAANLVAIPVVTLLITPLALLGSLVAPMWTLATVVLQALIAFLELLASWPAAVWTVPAAPTWARAAGLLGAALLVLPLPWRLRFLAWPLLLPLLMPPLEPPREGEFELLAADVGQGTAVLVRTRTRLLVYDAGPQYARDSDAGQRVLLPLLRALGETRIHTLLLSHRDSDHVGGARALLGALPVDRLLSSLEPGHALLAGSRNAMRCEAGQSWTWDGVRFELLHPPPAAYERGLKPNAVSCVLRLSAASGRSALLAGDIEREQELALAEAQGAALRSDVLLVPHHGSKTSSTPEFLAVTTPALAVVQAGYRNRFGHPATEVLERYQRLGVPMLTSPSCGAWRWRSDEPLPGVCQRDAARRYWHHGPAPEPE
jgi:competence protein ComEC